MNHAQFSNTGLSRRELLTAALVAAVAPRLGWAVETAPAGAYSVDPALARDWLARWEKSILNDARNRYCDKEMGEELGWLVSPFLHGFYYGYLATGDAVWIDRLLDWADAWIRRGIKEPDGYTGWPKDDGASTGVVPGLYTDNILGEAMALLPVIRAAGAIGRSPALQAKHGAKADQYVALSEQVFAKWDARCAWREVSEGGVWVVPEFGIDKQTHGWTSGYATRQTTGFTLPANKQNFIAQWLLAMHDRTGKPIYRTRAEKWFRIMKSRQRLREGKFYVWNYWDPAGPWDYNPDKTTRHWVGVHPNGGYYAADLSGIVAAFEHGLIFDQADIARLIATNRDYMWDQKIGGARFRRIDGGTPDARWKNSPGVLWAALLPYDATLRQVFEANHQPESWGGLAETPWYVARQRGVLAV